MEFFKNITIAYFKSLFELKLMSSFHNQNKIMYTDGMLDLNSKR